MLSSHKGNGHTENNDEHHRNIKRDGNVPFVVSRRRALCNKVQSQFAKCVSMTENVSFCSKLEVYKLLEMWCHH